MDETAHSFVKRLEKNQDLIDILIEAEDFLDSLSLYAYDNWLDSEIISGPHIRKYWIDMTLKLPYKKMPDPKGGMRLVKSGCKVTYIKGKEQLPADPDKSTLDKQQNRKPKMKLVPIWLIKLSIPRRFIEINAENVELSDEDPDHLKGAKDEGITQESGYKPELLGPGDISDEDFAQ